ELENYPFEREPGGHQMRAPATEDLTDYLRARGIASETEAESETAGSLRDKRQQFEAVKRWFYHDWMRIEPKLRTSIVEGISVFLSLFDDNPTVKRIFCPPKDTYDPVVNHDGRYGKPLPSFADLIETGAVCA